MRSLRDDAVLLDAPGGEPLAWSTGEAGAAWSGRVRAEAVGGHVPIAVQLDGIAIEGWVHVDDLDDRLALRSVGRASRGQARCGLQIHLPLCTYLPEETLLRSSPGGPVVGKIVEAVRVSEAAIVEGLWIEQHTPLGDVSLFARPQDVVDLRGSEACPR